MPRNNHNNYADFVRRVALMQGDAIDLGESKYLGDDEIIDLYVKHFKK